jgi:hypothetical protein
MRLGFGLSLIPFVAIVLNIVGIPADWRIILVISLLYPAYTLVRNFSKFDFSGFKIKITKTNLSIFAMLLIFFGTFYVYGSGAFNYPYLEDDDPWGHAEGVKYVSVEKNVFIDSARSIRYLNPYPPTYDLLLGILHQSNDSVYWTLKFFNALIVSLSIIFFYFFVKEFSGNKNKALFASFALASIPAFLSHFIWALALSVPLYFVVFYAVERIKYDKKWWIVAGLVMFTTLTSSPTHSTYFGLFFVLYFVTKAILERKLLIWHMLAGIFGLSLSFLFWWLPMLLKHGFIDTLSGIGFRTRWFTKYGGADSILNALGGTGDRVYTFTDFFIAQEQNMVNNPIGIGIFLSILTAVAVVFLFFKFRKLFKSENHWLVITFVWFVFTLYAVNAAQFSIKLSPFRAWMLLAIPVCILAAEGFFLISTKIDRNLQWGVLAVFAIPFMFNKWNIIGISFIEDLLNFLNQIPILNILIVSPHFISQFLIPYIIFISFLVFVVFKQLLNKTLYVQKISLSLLLILLVASSSGIPKYAVNTASTWPAGGFWTSSEEIGGYLWMKDNIAPNTKVFGFVINGPIIGMDKFICYWCDDIREFKKDGVNKTASEISSFLTERDYEYLIIGGQFVDKYGGEETNAKLQELVQSGLFTPVFQNQGMVILAT